MNRLVAVHAVFLAIATAACGQAMKQPDIKLNPKPKMRYEITLTIEDAPGPFEAVTGFMQYEVQNEQDCVPADAISGHHERLSSDPDVDFRRVEGSNTFKGVVYLDLIKDEDYYGLGVCRWKMTGFTAVMKAAEVAFNPYISGDQIAKSQSKTEFFAKSAYGDKSLPNQHIGGSPKDDAVNRYRSEFFSTTLTAEEKFQ